MTRVLVTGALGFVGLNIVRGLALKGYEVLALGRRNPDEATLSFIQDVQSNIAWTLGDVTDRQTLINLVKAQEVSHILHAAALTASPAEEIADPARMFDINASGTLNVLEAARLAGIQRVVFVSSTVVYGGAPPTPLKTEEDELVIDGLYSVCKQTSEHLCRLYNDRYNLNTVVGRLGSAYGPMERPTYSRQRMSVLYTAAQAALKNRSLSVFGRDIARDYCYIDDVTEAFIHLLFQPKLMHLVYNVGSPQAYTLDEVLETLQTIVPSFSWKDTSVNEAEVSLIESSARAGLSLERLRKDGNWIPGFSLHKGLQTYLEWLKSNQMS